MSAKKTKKNKKIGIFGKIWLVSNIFFAVCLLLSFFSGMVNPQTCWVLAFFGLSFLVLFLINVFYFILYALSLKWLCVVSLIPILLNFHNIKAVLNYAKVDKPVAGDIKVLTYNVNLFDYYQFRNEVFGGAKEYILDFLQEENPDIVCFQEYLETTSADFRVNEFITEHLHLKYHTQAKCNTKLCYGTIIYSKYPILNEGVVVFPEKGVNDCIYADLLINQDTVRVYNFHLQSIKFNKEDEIFYDEFANNKKVEVQQVKNGMKKMLSKMKIAYQKRAPQAKVVAEHVAKSPYPAIVCGDMNDTPPSFAYHQLAKKLADSYDEKGFGFGSTYHGLFPSFRIDYIFHSKPAIQTIQSEVLRVDFSDHYPVISVLRDLKPATIE